MRKFFKLVIDLIKLFALLIGSLLLFGGGACGSMLGVGGLYELTQGKDLGQLFFAGILLLFALLGYGLIRWADPDDSTVRKPAEFKQAGKNDRQ